MENHLYIQTLKGNFNFLNSISQFDSEIVESSNYILNVKFISDQVGLYFVYEFRDLIPRIQITLLKSNILSPRVGLYTLKEFYKNRDFRLNSFYLDEILTFKGKDYRSYFDKINTIESAIKVVATLVKEYTVEFIKGDETSYFEMEDWFRNQVMSDD